MATQTANLIAAFQAIGIDIKALYTNQGNLASLTTTQKGNLVAALNELKSSITTAGVSINDTTATTTSTYSSSKIESAITAAIAAIVDGAPSTFDTLKEISDYIASDTSAMGTITTALSKRVRFDSLQTLTEVEQIQACENIGIGDPTTDFETTYNTAKA